MIQTKRRTSHKDTVRPFLRWAGSKRQIVRTLAGFVDEPIERYVEPFAGSACLFFHLRPPKALIGDINKELILTYRELKYRLPQVLYYLRKLRKGRKEYLKIRKQNPNEMTKPERAARFIYLNRFCFNGLYRTNRSGRFNVPYGGDKSGDLPSAQSLRSCARSLRSTKLVAGDFALVLEQVREGDFVYMDPPFSVDGRRVFKEYSETDFGDADVHRVRRWMQILDDKKIPFLVSYAKCKEAEYLAKGYAKRVVRVRRNIAGFAGDRALTKEYLISNRNLGRVGQGTNE